MTIRSLRTCLVQLKAVPAPPNTHLRRYRSITVHGSLFSLPISFLPLTICGSSGFGSSDTTACNATVPRQREEPEPLKPG
ncbi:hypothetical protein PAHAL_8G078100 [Panicum hallii]|uniref:Uncharacterized protein n=1 Tax=Panicum hallii TaxID=206008 RepID=A0A2T8I846_9POAL|nr:hypothetical protein PAHAL_8G078100 [Panicum hallii]